jgi:hypothetical protein
VYFDSSGTPVPGILLNGSSVTSGTIIYVTEKDGGDTNGTILQGKSILGDSFTSTDPNGSSANYSHNTNFVETFCPTNSAQKLTIAFTRFRTQDSNDSLRIYDGDSISAPLVDTWFGNRNSVSNRDAMTQTSTAANGCLTLRFVTNGNGSLRE